MHFRNITATTILLLVLFLSMGNKNGRAASQGRGNTGAPGDETSLGSPKTCMNCHNQGPITASVAITVLDAANQPVTQYHPGQQYTATVKITASGANLQGYGFQMIALRDAGNTDLDGFSDTNPNNYKIATIANGRTYAEHDNISSTNTFSVKWTAPVAGTGNVTFYASGNGVNANGTTGGDGAGFFSLKLTEAAVSPAQEPTKAPVTLHVSPNPVSGEALLDLGELPSGACRLRAFDAAAHLVWDAEWTEPPLGKITLPTAEWSPGVYLIHLEGAKFRGIVKVVKL